MNTAQILNVVWPYLVTGGGISVVTQVLKRLAKLENSATVRLLFHTVTALTVVLAYLLSERGISAGMLALQGTAFSGIASAAFPLVSHTEGFLRKLYAAFQVINATAPQVETAIAEAAAMAAVAAPAASIEDATKKPAILPADF